MFDKLWPMKDKRLNEFVNHYIKHCTAHHERGVRRYQKMPSLEDAIHHAALAKPEKGNRESHQRRLKLRDLKRFEEKLQRMRHAVKRCRSFEELHEVVAKQKVKGVGPLAIYDTAARIGAYLRCRPKKMVYLHAGARAGANVLGLKSEKGRIAMADLQSPLKKLRADDVENFLCIYKKWLECDRLPKMSDGICGDGDDDCLPKKRRTVIC